MKNGPEKNEMYAWTKDELAVRNIESDAKKRIIIFSFSDANKISNYLIKLQVLIQED